MDDWICFEGRIVPMEWGDSVYTVLPLPKEVSEALTAQHAKRVDIELNDHPFNMALTKAPVIDHVFVYTGKTVLAAASVTPGELLEVRLRKADHNYVEVPQDVTLAVLKHGLTDMWDAVTPGKKRGYLHAIVSAKRPQTRADRIAKLIAELKT